MSPARTGFRAVLSAVFLCTLFLASDPARADEGMWTIHDFPSGAVAERYGASIGPEWLARVQRATVRLDGGCTGSFSSANGLVLTNNHCVWGCIRNLSTDEENLSETGFLAASREQERQCPGARVSVLNGYEDITAAVAEATADWATATAKAFGTAQGKTCIVVKDGPGFYTTRILAPYLNEAVLLIEEGARIEDVDKAMKDFGYPTGTEVFIIVSAAKGTPMPVASSRPRPGTRTAQPSRYSHPRIASAPASSGPSGRDA